MEFKEGLKNNGLIDSEIVPNLDNTNSYPVDLPLVPASIQVPENNKKVGNKKAAPKLPAKPMSKWKFLPNVLKLAPKLKEQIFQEAYYDGITPEEMVKRHNLNPMEIRSILMIMKAPDQKLPTAFKTMNLKKQMKRMNMRREKNNQKL